MNSHKLGKILLAAPSLPVHLTNSINARVQDVVLETGRIRLKDEYWEDTKNRLGYNPDTSVNLIHVSGNMYVVRTQAGLEKAIRNVTSILPEDNYEIIDYPTEYPCLVAINCVWQSKIGNVRCYPIHIDKLLGLLARM